MKPWRGPNRSVVHRLVQHIRRERMSPGDRLPSIRRLAALWDIGPNFVRDGLLHAQTLGLVRVHPRSGAFVQTVDFSSLVDGLADTLDTALAQEDANLFHLIEARALLETEVIDRSVARRRPEDLFPLRQALEAMRDKARDRAGFVEADEKFHLAVTRMTGNPVLVIILRALLVLLRPYRLHMTPTSGRQRRTLRQHEAIYRCVVEGDRQGACAAMHDHLADHRRRAAERVGVVEKQVRPGMTRS